MKSQLANTSLWFVVVASGILIFFLLGLPLPFLLGALAGSAVASNYLKPLGYSHVLRKSGQIILGTAVCGALSPDATQLLIDTLPHMLAVALALNAVALLIALPVRLFAKVDWITAVLGCLPAGIAEMSSLARELGGNPHMVAVMQTLRIVLLLAFLPFLVTMLDVLPSPAAAGGAYEHLWFLALFIILSASLAYGAALIGIFNPWIIVPMLLGLVVFLVGLRVPTTPSALVIAAQIMLGLSIGAGFDIKALTSLPKAFVAGVFSTVLLVAAAALIIAPLLHVTSHIALETAILAVAPGGLAEMIASAKALGLSSAIVAGFQFIRSLSTNALAPIIVRSLQRRTAARKGRGS